MNDPLPAHDSIEEFHPQAVCSMLRERDERLEGLKIFAGKLAHDFRNTLVPLLGYITLIKEQAGEDASVLPFLQKLENASRKLEADLDTILFAIRPERRHFPKPCDFSALVKRSLDSWSNALPKDASIRIESGLAPCTLVADEAQWTYVFEQLLKNARFALAAGGTVSVTLRNRTVTNEQAASLNVIETDLLQLVVRDTGFGMSESVRRRACEPFFSTRAKGQAAGLGLTTAYSVTRLYGGQLVVESTEDVGTTVTIWLPKTRQPLADHKPTFVSVSSEVSRPSAKARILLVSADVLLTEAIRAYLRRTPIEIVLAQDGSGGLKIFQKASGDLQALVLDVSQPGLDARELVAKFRQIDTRIPLIIIICGEPTASGETNWATGEESPSIVLRKPFSLKALLEAISP